MKQLLLALLVLLISLSAYPQSARDENMGEPSTNNSITGRVVTESGQPIPNAQLFIETVRGPRQFRRIATDKSGSFKIPGLDPALYVLSASAPTYVQQRFTRLFDTYESQLEYYRVGEDVTLTLIKGGVITGTVTTSTGEPVVGIGVRAMMIRDADNQPLRTRSLQLGERLTDDRGVYRLYGLPAGTYLVSTSNRGGWYFRGNAFQGDSPTFAPSSTRDTAAEVTVRSGEETTGVDIRHRGEPGHTISGTVSGLSQSGNNPFNGSINLRQFRNGVLESNNVTFITPTSSSFEFSGIADGEYSLQAQSTTSAEVLVSEPISVSVKGADVTGLVLPTKQLATLSGRVALESSTAIDCKNKRRPLFEEMLLQPLKVKPAVSKELLSSFSFPIPNQPDKNGEFVLRNLVPGRYGLSNKFFAKYWYVKGITQSAFPAGVKTRATDLGRNGITIKYGEKLTNITVTLAEGAASIRGHLKLSEGQKVPLGFFVFLAPAELDAVDDPFRYSAAAVDVDGKFLLSNVQPGSYWLISLEGNSDSLNARNIRDVDRNEQRLKLRRDAEATKTVITLKPCQNVTDYELSLKQD